MSSPSTSTIDHNQDGGSPQRKWKGTSTAHRIAQSKRKQCARDLQAAQVCQAVLMFSYGYIPTTVKTPTIKIILIGSLVESHIINFEATMFPWAGCVLGIMNNLPRSVPPHNKDHSRWKSSREPHNSLQDNDVPTGRPHAG
eukprot:scaffold143527_cov65-Attheya_sp.AAC.3